MSAPNTILKNFAQFKGVDLKSSDLSRPSEYASDMLNAEYNNTNAINKRKGFQYLTTSIGGFGLDIYKDTNLTTGAVTETVVTVDDSLYKLVDDSFNITYSGSGNPLLNISLDVDAGTFKLIITEDTVEILNQDLGIGLDETSATPISTVVSAIDALADYAATSPTLGTGSGAFLELHYDTILSSTATSISFKRWSIVNESKANPLATSLGQRNTSDFENYSFANLNNVLYVASGYDDMMKYDGQTFYRAGMPAGGDTDGSGDVGLPATTSEPGTGATFHTGETYYYKYLYKQVDNKGNIVEGILSPISTLETIAAANTNISVVVRNILATSGFNTNCAVINGNQSTTSTITVDSGHTMLAGDTAYFYDTAANLYVTRTVSSVTATTLVLAGAVVSVTDNYIISNNLRIGIYRTINGGSSVFSLVAEIPNDSIGTATQTYTDATPDASLGSEYVVPIKSHGLPGKSRYLTTFRNILIQAGIPTSVNEVRWSDIDSPEYFPAESNTQLVDAYPGAKIMGIGSLDTSFIVFKDISIQSFVGDVGDATFRVDEIASGGIGCVAHHSIQKIGGSLFFLSNTGVYSVDLKSGVSKIGELIAPEFTTFGVEFNFQKATSINWINKYKYVLYMPVEATDGSSNKYTTSDSKIYVFDYNHGAWLIWDSINAQGGFAYTNDTMYFHSRRLDGDSLTTKFPLAVFNNYGNRNDFSDHVDEISFEYTTHWETMGEPSVFKKFLRLKVYALLSDVFDGVSPLYTLTVETEHDFNAPTVVGPFDMDFTGGTDGWGGAWGTSPYGDSTPPMLKGKLKVIKSRAMRFIFKNSVALENVLISGYEIEAVLPYKPMMKA